MEPTARLEPSWDATLAPCPGTPRRAIMGSMMLSCCLVCKIAESTERSSLASGTIAPDYYLKRAAARNRDLGARNYLTTAQRRSPRSKCGGFLYWPP
jgi:hypothetical protein